MNQILIPKSEILAEIRKTTQYIGAKTIKPEAYASGTGATAFETIGAIEENEEILWRFCCEAVTEIRSKRIRASQSSVSVPDNETLEQIVRAYLIYYGVWKWLLLGNAVTDRAPLYEQWAKASLGEAQGLLAEMEADEIGGDVVAASNNIGGLVPQQLCDCDVVVVSAADYDDEMQEEMGAQRPDRPDYPSAPDEDRGEGEEGEGVVTPPAYEY